MNATVKLADSSLVDSLDSNPFQRCRFPEPDGAADVLAGGSKQGWQRAGRHVVRSLQVRVGR